MNYVELLFDVLLLYIYAVILAVLLTIAFAIVRHRIEGLFIGIVQRLEIATAYNKIDLADLEKLLSEKRWQEADDETNRLMIWATYSRNAGIITHDKILNFPEEMLMAMDTLWAKHSNGRFGFNIQRLIYIELGTNADQPYQENEVIIEKFLTFADYVGWRVGERYLQYEELTFDITVPLGHLPACKWLFPTRMEIISDEHREFYRAKALLFLVKRW